MDLQDPRPPGARTSRGLHVAVAHPDVPAPPPASSPTAPSRASCAPVAGSSRSGALFPTEGNFGVSDCLSMSRLRRPHRVLITVCARLTRLVVKRLGILFTVSG